MNRQPVLTQGNMTLRPLVEDDRDALYQAANDKKTWAGHPSSDRWKPEVYAPYFDLLVASGETLVVELDDTVIGCSRFYTPDEDKKGIAIGFTFINSEHWGGAINRRMKSLMLEHAYTEHDAVWFHIAPTNFRSQKATLKLGAEFTGRAMRDVCGTQDDWMSYKLTQEKWHNSAP